MKQSVHYAAVLLVCQTWMSTITSGKSQQSESDALPKDSRAAGVLLSQHDQSTGTSETNQGPGDRTSPLSTMLVLNEFRDRFNAACKSGVAAGIISLYQPGILSSAERRTAENIWKQRLSNKPGGIVMMHAKELATLPSVEARQFWARYARNLTDHEVTHIVLARIDSMSPAVLPLSMVDGKLWILPYRSDAIPRAYMQWDQNLAMDNEEKWIFPYISNGGASRDPESGEKPSIESQQ